ncbi:MAG: glycosyl hydrolase, partial [Actinobacteria bacterium]|nr:glycosyl hydrolase [Actinomycetota bacterium]NIS36195.1 glycosyl hydrolase [Actinomycetota bacterium]NIT98575.1 glycosyl hydrolase [Actinomycetota bacterium]NIU22203.1 glycosyl hydrolase [Actinomycetota bacterium]NIU70760.1 glycosyl hydrolase [Actinomycetota bacterium]
ERIYLGGVQIPVSDDGGRTWREGDGAEGIHVDHHAMWIDPNDSEHIIIGNDGGVAFTFDRGETWRHHANLAVGQFYEVGVDMRDPYYVCGGLQDNSSWCGPSQTLNGYGIRNADWYDVSGGDGFYNQIDPTD